MKYYCLNCGREGKSREALTAPIPCVCGCYVIESERDVKERIKMGKLDPKKFPKIGV